MIRKRLVEFRDKYFPGVDLNENPFHDSDTLMSWKKIELPIMINEIDNLLNEENNLGDF